MKKKSGWSAAIAASAAASGVCFASGRTIAMFFAQTGCMSWLGVCAAAAAYGLICCGVCAMADRTGAQSLAGACKRLVGIRFGRAVGVVQSVLMALTALEMLDVAGDLAALVLPVRNAYWIGILMSLAGACMLSIQNMRLMNGFGMLTIVVCALFFAGQALDPRAVSYRRSYETVAELEGSAAAALMFAVLLAALCGFLSADVTARRARFAGGAVRFGFRCGGILLIMLFCANAALMRGGKKLLSQALPAVVLAARWGSIGFYACITVMFLCGTASLAASVAVLAGKGGRHQNMTKKRVKLCEHARKKVDE